MIAAAIYQIIVPAAGSTIESLYMLSAPRHVEEAVPTEKMHSLWAADTCSSVEGETALALPQGQQGSNHHPYKEEMSNNRGVL